MDQVSAQPFFSRAAPSIVGGVIILKDNHLHQNSPSGLTDASGAKTVRGCALTMPLYWSTAFYRQSKMNVDSVASAFKRVIQKLEK